MSIKMGLKFEPQNECFISMMQGLQKLVNMKYKSTFFLDASEKCEEIFSHSFTGPSNKLTGWLIPNELIPVFENCFLTGELIDDWQEYIFTLWTYYNGECSPDGMDDKCGWLYSFSGSSFGEKDICAVSRDDKC